MTSPADEFDCIVLNGTVVTAADIGPYDIGIRDGTIQVLAAAGTLKDARAGRVLDAAGAYVTPGGVDAHVHLDEVGISGGKGRSADDYASGTRSAIAGGTTTVMTFAGQERSDDSLLAILDRTHRQARDNCYCDYSFHVLLSNPTERMLAEFQTLADDQGIMSVKIFMTYEALQLRDDQILDVLLRARQTGFTTMVHAENGDMLKWMTGKLEQHGLFAPKYHATSRPQLLETEATNRAIALTQLVETPLVIVHVSSPSAAKKIRRAQTDGLPIFAETCPQYLFLTRAAMDQPGFEGAKCVCSPPPRDSRIDLEGIWTGLKNGTFSILSSDHCPFVYDDPEHGKKSAITVDAPEGRFRQIPNGCPGVETRLALTMSANRLPMQKFVEVTSTNPAKLYGIYPQKGSLIPGVSDADLNIWYQHLNPFPITNSMLHHNVDYTPYEGMTVINWPRYTLLRGKVVWDRDNGGVVGEKGCGSFVRCSRSSFFQELPAWNPQDF